VKQAVYFTIKKGGKYTHREREKLWEEGGGLNPIKAVPLSPNLNWTSFEEISKK